MNTQAWENGTVKISVDYDACTGQGQCVESCPVGVYDLIDGKAVPERIEDCIECCSCVEVCPEKAIAHTACE